MNIPPDYRSFVKPAVECLQKDRNFIKKLTQSERKILNVAVKAFLENKQIKKNVKFSEKAKASLQEKFNNPNLKDRSLYSKFKSLFNFLPWRIKSSVLENNLHEAEIKINLFEQSSSSKKEDYQRDDLSEESIDEDEIVGKLELDEDEIVGKLELDEDEIVSKLELDENIDKLEQNDNKAPGVQLEIEKNSQQFAQVNNSNKVVEKIAKKNVYVENPILEPEHPLEPLEEFILGDKIIDELKLNALKVPETQQQLEEHLRLFAQMINYFEKPTRIDEYKNLSRLDANFNLDADTSNLPTLNAPVIGRWCHYPFIEKELLHGEITVPHYFSCSLVHPEGQKKFLPGSFVLLIEVPDPAAILAGGRKDIYTPMMGASSSKRMEYVYFNMQYNALSGYIRSILKKVKQEINPNIFENKLYDLYDTESKEVDLFLNHIYSFATYNPLYSGKHVETYKLWQTLNYFKDNESDFSDELFKSVFGREKNDHETFAVVIENILNHYISLTDKGNIYPHKLHGTKKLTFPIDYNKRTLNNKKINPDRYMNSIVSDKDNRKDHKYNELTIISPELAVSIGLKPPRIIGLLVNCKNIDLNPDLIELTKKRNIPIYRMW